MIVQAGPNAQPGGCQLGLRRALYQLPIGVANPPATSSTAAQPPET